MVSTVILALTLNPRSYVHSTQVVTTATANLGAGSEEQVYQELLERTTHLWRRNNHLL